MVQDTNPNEEVMNPIAVESTVYQVTNPNEKVINPMVVEWAVDLATNVDEEGTSTEKSVLKKNQESATEQKKGKNKNKKTNTDKAEVAQECIH